MKGKTLAQLRKENVSLMKKQGKDEEYKKASQENYRLKHGKSIKFFQGISRVAGAGTRLAGRGVQRALRPPTDAERKRYFAVQKKLKRRSRLF